MRLISKYGSVLGLAPLAPPLMNPKGPLGLSPPIRAPRRDAEIAKNNATATVTEGTPQEINVFNVYMKSSLASGVANACVNDAHAPLNALSAAYAAAGVIATVAVIVAITPTRLASLSILTPEAVSSSFAPPLALVIVIFFLNVVLNVLDVVVLLVVVGVITPVIVVVIVVVVVVVVVVVAHRGRRRRRRALSSSTHASSVTSTLDRATARPRVRSALRDASADGGGERHHHRHRASPNTHDDYANDDDEYADDADDDDGAAAVGARVGVDDGCGETIDVGVVDGTTTAGV